MRRLGLLAALAACAPGTGESATDVDLGTSTTEVGITLQGVQTVTSETVGPETATTGLQTTEADTSVSTEPTSGTSTSAVDTDDTVGTGTTAAPVCGDGIAEGDEECDDGNDDDWDECLSDCRQPRCGDNVLHPGEECDDGNQSDEDACTNGCKEAFCGDGIVWLDMEECDDTNTDDTDDCRSNCRQAKCGDSILWAGHEVCDDGFNENDYGGCAKDCQSRADTYCGDGVLQGSYELCDGTSGMVGVGCTDDCIFDFSAVPQMSCAKTCSWAGPAGCDQEDADIFCKLRTGHKLSTAASFTLGAPTEKAGFPCSNANAFFDPDLRKPLGPLPEYGFLKPVYYQESKIASTHGNALVIQASTLVCTK